MDQEVLAMAWSSYAGQSVLLQEENRVAIKRANSTITTSFFIMESLEITQASKIEKNGVL